MSTKSDIEDRPFWALTDKQLAQLLFKMESILEKEEDSEEIDFDILLKRNNLIEEIIYRYTNSDQ